METKEDSIVLSEQGAAEQVTGSQLLLELSPLEKILIDLTSPVNHK